VPNQRALDVQEKLREHLRRQAYGDITVEARGTEPYKTPTDAPIVEVVAETAEEIYGIPPIILPSMAGTGPMHAVCGLHGMPAVGTGVGYARGNSHGPNENIRLKDFMQGIHHVALLLKRFTG
jgi:acetylornithine deacetylase/succinyl-diaminopimelate desuccinylase-like protein